MIDYTSVKIVINLEKNKLLVSSAQNVLRAKPADNNQTENSK